MRRPLATRLRAFAGVLAVLGFGAGLAASGAAQAQPMRPASLTLEEVIDSARVYYPLIEVAELERQSARMNELAARGGFDPSIKGKGKHIPTGPYEYTQLESQVVQPTPYWGADVFGGWRIGRGDIPSYYNYETNRYGELRAGINLPLWRDRAIDSRRTSLAKARLGIRVADFGWQQYQIDTTRTAAQKYWDWVGAGQKVRIARSLLRIAERRNVQLSQRVRKGDAPLFDQTDNMRTLLQRQAGVITAERSFNKAALDLSLYLRDESGSPVVVGEERMPEALPEPHALADLAKDPDLTEVLSRRPDVNQLQAKREQTELDLTLAENQRAPMVDLIVAASKDLGPGSEKLARPELELGLNLDIPILNRGPTGRARVADLAVSAANAQLRLQRDRVAIEITDSIQALEATLERVTLARREVSAAHELERGELTRFSEGDSNLIFVNTREQTSAEAQGREVDAVTDHFKAAAALRAALALPQTTQQRRTQDGRE